MKIDKTPRTLAGESAGVVGKSLGGRWAMAGHFSGRLKCLETCGAAMPAPQSIITYGYGEYAHVM